MTPSTLPFISILIPTWNEEKYIARCLASVLAAGYPEKCFEILVADGKSTDRTKEIVESLALSHPEIHLLDNPLKLQSAGVNVAAVAADPRSEFFIRLDAHSLYPEGFLTRCVETAFETKAELVVYVNEPHGSSPFQRAVAYAFSHPIGVGDSLYRLGRYSGWVEHGQHGCFRREVFERLGGYDDAMGHNEDAELSCRILMDGGRIYLNSELRMQYFPRTKLSALSLQYFTYGRGRAANILKHGTRPRLRQVIPPVYLLTEIGSLVASLKYPIFLLIPAAYLASITAVAIVASVKQRRISMLLVSVALWLMHHAWAVGFLYGLFMREPATVSPVRQKA